MDWVKRVKGHKGAESSVVIATDWKRVKERLEREDLYINCKTEGGADDLLQNLHKEGYTWANSRELRESSHYIYNEATCYRVDRLLKEVVVMDKNLAKNKGVAIFEYRQNAENTWKSWGQRG